MILCSKNVRRLLPSLVLCVYLLDVSVDGQWVVDDEGCRTPDGGAGDCIPIKQCEPIISFLSNSPKPLSQKTIKRLNSYTCSFEANTVNVCCPSSPIKTDDGENLQTNAGLPGPPDVSNHRNYNLLPKDCGYLPIDDKIINGQNAGLSEFPWMALLSYNTNRGPEFKCGGSVINDKWILTAAHCVTNLKQPLLGVRVGEHNIRTNVDCEIQQNGNEKCASPVQDLAVEKIVPHPDFSLSIISNDIALVKVSRMNLNVENVRPVCLPVDNARDAKFSSVIVTGWGVTESGRSSNLLQKVTLPVVATEECQSVYNTEAKVRISHRQICAGGKNNKDSCPGDSGGPMHVGSFLNDETRYVQQGIVSFGHRECGRQGFPGVYTRVAFYMDWILDTIAT
ncbi:hypothetical protein NQ315_009588 [Exocentrus adspersus]|uniref:CLIP domain-containing serine protease n=1 Tax=Exocentrus adspersus TaxID=1586481 RepID=A0AAV8WHW0_9CUCU|nr:hypothetical protein NQ315_009588 [Exocentrus adspersus]